MLLSNLPEDYLQVTSGVGASKLSRLLIVKSHLETLLLLTTTREGREVLRKVKVYPIVRECHLHIEDEEVRDACDRLVQILMRDEEGEEKDIADSGVAAGGSGRLIKLKNEEEDEEEQLVEIL